MLATWAKRARFGFVGRCLEPWLLGALGYLCSLFYKVFLGLLVFFLFFPDGLPGFLRPLFFFVFPLYL